MADQAAVAETDSASDSYAEEAILIAYLMGRYGSHSASVIDLEIRALVEELVRLLTLHDFTSTRNLAVRTQRVRALLEEADLALRTAYSSAGRMLARDIKAAIFAASEHAADSINRVIGFDRAKPTDADGVNALYATLAIEGGLVMEWWKRIVADAKFRFARAIKAAYDKAMPLGDTVTMIRGTPDKGFQDGLFSASRRNISSLLKTAIYSGIAAAQAKVVASREDVISGVQQLSVIDKSTTPVCRSYNLRIWSLPNYAPIGHNLPYGNGVPRHWACRSTIVPIFKAFDDLPTKIQTRMAFDGNAGIMTGKPPADWSFIQWLERQSPAMRKAILGTKYAAWQAGADEDELLGQAGNPISLREMRKLLGL